MIEEKLESLKKEYLKTKTSDYLVNYGWSNLESRLNNQTEQRHLAFINPARIALAFSAFLIIFAVPFVFSQNAKPGESLYPLKIASDTVTAKVTGNYEANIEKRAQEVIQTSENGESFEEASKQYQQTIDEAKNKAERGDEAKKEELRKKLEEQEKKFEGANKESQKSKKRLEEIRDKTRQIRGEVKGNKDEKEKENNKNGGGSNENSNDGDSENEHEDD